VKQRITGSRNAAIAIAGIELMQRIHKGQFALGRARPGCAGSLEGGAL